MALAGDGSSAFSRALASNSRKQRDAALFALTQWLGARASVEESDLMKIWKGQFYAMWHADKAPVQARAHCTREAAHSAACFQRSAHAGPLSAQAAASRLSHARPLRQAEVAESMAAVLDACQPEVGDLPARCPCCSVCAVRRGARTGASFSSKASFRRG
jgi:hypothetical protein